MPKIFLTVKRVIQQGNTPTLGSASFAGLQNVGVFLNSVLDSRVAKAVGINIVGGLWQGTVPEMPGIQLTNVNEGVASASLNPSVKCTDRLDISNLGEPKAGAEIVHVKYDLTHNRGGTSAASTGTWTTPNNSTGQTNATTARNANTVTVAASGDLTLSYAAQPNRTDLTIVSVHLDFYGSYDPGLTAPCTARINYGLDGGSGTTLLSTTADFGNQSFDITSAVGGDWSKIAALKTKFTLTGSASATPSVFLVDACHVRVVATRTDSL